MLNLREAQDLVVQRQIEKEDWEKLVEYFGGDANLTLATRIFYLLNTHSTHSFDYRVMQNPKSDELHDEIVREYLSRTHDFLKRIAEVSINDKDLHFLAAQVIGPMNQRDLDYFSTKEK